jgi:hypothetical protein
MRSSRTRSAISREQASRSRSTSPRGRESAIASDRRIASSSCCWRFARVSTHQVGARRTHVRQGLVGCGMVPARVGRCRVVCAPGVHLRRSTERGFDRREAPHRRLAGLPGAKPDVGWPPAIPVVQTHEGCRGGRRPRRGRAAAGLAHRPAAGLRHGRRMVGPVAADGHQPTAEHEGPGRAVLPNARPAEVRTHADRHAGPNRRTRVGRRARLRRRVERRASCTIHRVVQLLNKCIGAAFDDRMNANNPVDKLPLPRIERREMRFLTADEVMPLCGMSAATTICQLAATSGCPPVASEGSEPSVREMSGGGKNGASRMPATALG